MPCYISSNDNRFYVALESQYGAAAAVTAANRIPAVRLAAQQRAQKVERRDKTGSRTFAGHPAGLRRETAFELHTYMTAWTNQQADPVHGPLMEGVLGGEGVRFVGGTVESSADGKRVSFVAPHGLTAGQAVAFGGEIRFVSNVVDTRTVRLNAPLTMLPTPGSPFSTTITYRPANRLRGVSLYDCWSPAAAVQRILTGCAMNRMRIKVNADFHEFEFSGPAKDLLDSSSFESGQGGLSSFPTEPSLTQSDYTLIPGNLGQVWLGGAPTRHYTLTAAEVSVHNDVDLRSQEFGFDGPRCIVPGERTVGISFSLFDQGSDSTKELYQAARQRSPISVMLQLGEQPGQMFGIYMANVVPEVPEFDDGDRRLQWRFTMSRAQGSADDEIAVAFG